jgi:hypothetical protein
MHPTECIHNTRSPAPTGSDRMRSRLRVGGCIAMNSKQASYDFGRAAARHATFGGDAEIGHISGGGRDAFVGGFDAISVNQAQEQVCAGRELQFPRRLEVGVVRALHRNRHMKVRDGARDGIRHPGCGTLWELQDGTAGSRSPGTPNYWLNSNAVAAGVETATPVPEDCTSPLTA